mgnify:CR=1 FL=1
MLEHAYNFLFSDQRRAAFERVILGIAIAGFLIHLLLIYLANFGLLPLKQENSLFSDPIAAAYTPFSFILVYEVYLLVYYLPRSITTYIRTQYEIITLIMIRRLFKDLSSVEISTNWFDIQGDLQFTYDLVGSLLLFYLLYLFAHQSRRQKALSREETPDRQSIERFIKFKKGLAVCLIPVLFAVATYTFVTWTLGVVLPDHALASSFTDINSIFFDQFFEILITVDVILLLFSFFVTNDFHKIIRNSGFIVSTVLIRLSFSAGGLASVALIVSSVLFGLLILLIFNQHQKAEINEGKLE